LLFAADSLSVSELALLAARFFISWASPTHARSASAEVLP
jgi:hypothetical protein